MYVCYVCMYLCVRGAVYNLYTMLRAFKNGYLTTCPCVLCFWEQGGKGGVALATGCNYWYGYLLLNITTSIYYQYLLYCRYLLVVLPMTSFIERKVNDICGRWLDGFTKDNVDISLLEAKITLSDLYFKTVSRRFFFLFFF